jgi:hypothetical protein
VDKKKAKLQARRCIFCKEDDPCVLDVHRITAGCNGGQYQSSNVVVLCANCHRKVHHSDRFEIDGWYSTTGGTMLHCFINGEEQYIKYDRIQ